MPTRRICPNCGTPTFAEGAICRACRHDLEPNGSIGRKRTAQLVAEPPYPERETESLAAAAPPFEAAGPKIAEPDKPSGTPWLARLRAEWRANALLITSIVFASLGWGAAIGVLTSMQGTKPTPPAATINSVLTTDLSQKLHERDQELASLIVQVRSLSSQLDTARRTADRRATEVEEANNARASAHYALDAQTGTLSSLRQQVADLKNDNSGLEQNYNDLLNSLHRTQDETFRDERLLVAAAAAQKKADERVAAAKAAIARYTVAKYHKSR